MLARVLAVAAVLAVGGGVFWRLRGPSRCDGAQLQRAVVALERLPYAQRPGEAAQAILRACPKPDSPMTLGWLRFVISTRKRDMVRHPLRSFDPDEARYHAMWAEVCPNGPSLAAVGETRAHERTTLHDDCDFGRLGILDPAIGRRITGHSIRTWALVPWLQEMSVSPDTMRDLLRALFLLYGWSDHPRLPSGLVLPRAPGTPPHPLDYAEVWTVHAGEIRDDGDILVTSTTTAGWSFALLDVLLRRPQGRIALFADASTSAEVVLRFAQMAQRADASLHLVVETDEPYLPYAALPVVIARAASPAAVQVNPSATLAELAPTIAAKLPCCGEGSPAQCPRECATVPLFADGFPPPRPAPDPFPDDDPDAGTPWPSAPSPAAPWHPVHVDADD